MICYGSNKNYNAIQYSIIQYNSLLLDIQIQLEDGLSILLTIRVPAFCKNLVPGKSPINVDWINYNITTNIKSLAYQITVLSKHFT